MATIDKSKTLNTTVTLVNVKLHYIGKAETGAASYLFLNDNSGCGFKVNGCYRP